MTHRIRLFALSLIVMVSLVAVNVAGAVSLDATPTIDVNSYANGVFGALTANLTNLLKVGGIMAGLFIVVRLVKRFVRAG